MPLAVSTKHFFSAVVTILLTRYTFYAFIKVASNIKPSELLPCTAEQPCQSMRFWAAENQARTAPNFVQVSSNIDRPITIAWDWSSAVPCIYDRVLPESTMMLWGYLLGGFSYQMHDAKNPSTPSTLGQFCLAGICVDNADDKKWFPPNSYGLSLGSLVLSGGIRSSIRSLQHETNSSFTRTWLKQHVDTKSAVVAVGKAMEDHKWGFLFSSSFQVTRGMLNCCQWCIIQALTLTGFSTASTTSRPDTLPAPRCADHNTSQMVALCNQEHTKSKFINTLTSSPSLQTYLWATLFWVMCTISHDLFVMNDVPEFFTLAFAFVTLLIQAVAVGAGFSAAMGAAEFFHAPVHTNGGHEEPCACYYRLASLPTFIMMLTPCALLYSYTLRRNYWYQSVLYGDHLCHKDFNFPYYLLRQNLGWTVQSSLLLPNIRGNAERVDSPHRELTAESFKMLAWMGASLRYFDVVFVAIPVLLASGEVFPRIMEFMAFNSGTGFGSSLPFVATVLGTIHTVWTCFGAGHDWPMWIAGLLIGLCVLSTSVILLPPWYIFGSRSPEPPELLVYYYYWGVGGFLFVMTVGLSKLEFVTGLADAYGSMGAVICNSPMDSKRWLLWYGRWGTEQTVQAWKDVNPNIVEALQLNEPHAWSRQRDEPLLG